MNPEVVFGWPSHRKSRGSPDRKQSLGAEGRTVKPHLADRVDDPCYLVVMLIAYVLLFFSCPSLASPAAPAGFSASKALAEKVTLSWMPSKGADSYRIFRASSVAGRKQLLGVKTGRTFTDLSVVPRESYVYWVRACSKGKCGKFSAPISGTSKKKVIGSPSRLSVSTNAEARIQLSWRGPLGATKYQVFRDGVLYKSSVTGTSFVDTQVLALQNYRYSLRACNRFNTCSKKVPEVQGMAMPTSTADPLGEGDDILDLIPAALVRESSSITFSRGQIAERCAVRWEDSWQPTGTVRWYRNDGDLFESPHPVWKKLSHCLKVVTTGPVGATTLDSSLQSVVDRIELKTNACVTQVLNDKETERLVALVAAIAADIADALLQGCAAGCSSTITVVGQYLEHVAEGALSCAQQLDDFAIASTREFVDSFDVYTQWEDEWIEWEM